MKYLCNNCGSQHPRKQCPAYGKRCRQCGKLNHFAKHCRSPRRKVEAVERDKESSNPDALFVGAIENANKTELTTDECHTTLQVEGHSVKFKVDTGSQVNILLLNVYRKLSTKSSLTKPSTKLTSYSGETLKVEGHSRLTCQNKPIDFYIVDTMQDPILGLSASRELGIIKIVLNVDRRTQNYFKV